MYIAKFEKVPYPSSIVEAKQLINLTFHWNKWNYQEQQVYFAGLGIKEDLSQLSPEQTRTVIDDLEKSRMILFK